MHLCRCKMIRGTVLYSRGNDKFSSFAHSAATIASQRRMTLDSRHSISSVFISVAVCFSVNQKFIGFRLPISRKIRDEKGCHPSQCVCLPFQQFNRKTRQADCVFLCCGFFFNKGFFYQPRDCPIDTLSKVVVPFSFHGQRCGNLACFKIDPRIVLDINHEA